MMFPGSTRTLKTNPINKVQKHLLIQNKTEGIIMNVSKSITTLSIAAFALSAVIFSAPIAEAKGGVNVAPVKQVKTMKAKIGVKKGSKPVKQASLKQPLQIAQLDKKTEVAPTTEKVAEKKAEKTEKASEKATKKAAAKAEKAANKAEKASVKESKSTVKETKPNASAK
jgi:hypothetical protein